MGWTEYYHEPHVRLFNEQTAYYQHAIEKMAECEPILDDSPKVFVLGGFHPLTFAAYDFRDFCSRPSCPQQKDRSIFLDLNPEPLQSLNPKSFPLRLQADLANLPFKDTIDFLFLDFTLDFMKDTQVTEFASGANKVLRKNGLVLAMINPILCWKFFSRLLAKSKAHITCFNRTPTHLLNLTKNHLKLCFWGQNDCDHLMVFSRPDSNFPAHQGQTFVLEEDYLPRIVKPKIFSNHPKATLFVF